MAKKKNALISQDNRVTDERDTLSRLEGNCLALVIMELQKRYPVKKLDNGDYLYTYNFNDIKNERIFLSEDRLIECFGSQVANPKNNLTYIRRALSGLVHKPCHIPVTYEDDNSEWVEVNWLNYAERRKDEKGYWVEISNKVIPYIIKKVSEGRITYYYFYSYVELKNRYAQRFYEKCCQFKKSGWFTMSEDDIREKFNVYKIDRSTGKRINPLYPNHSQFRKKILENCQEDLKDKFDRGLIECYFEVKTLANARGKYLPNQWFFAIGTKEHEPDFSKWEDMTGRSHNKKEPEQLELFDNFQGTSNIEVPSSENYSYDISLAGIHSMMKRYLSKDPNFIGLVMGTLEKRDVLYAKKILDKIKSRREKYSNPTDNFAGILRTILEQDVLHLKK